MDLWLTPGTSMLQSLSITVSPVKILSERELWHLFLSKVIHTKPQLCLWLFVGFLVVATLITELQ